MLKRLRVRGFKSLRDVEITLAPLVVLFGPNAVGKSNLLEAVLLLSRLITERTVSEAFGPPTRGQQMESFTLPDGGLPELLSTDTVSLGLEGDLEIAPSREGGRRDTLRYGVGVEATPRTGELAVIDEYLARMNKDGDPKHKPRIEREDERLIIRRTGEAGQPRHEPLRLNHTLASNLQYSGASRYPDFDKLRAEVGAWRMYYLDPTAAMRAEQSPREVDDIGTAGETIASFLYRLRGSERQQGHFHAVSRALRSAIPTIDRLDVDLDKKRGTLDIQVRQGGTPLSSRIISEGTLRVLALCAIAANPWAGSLVAFEEPENGVHPRRIEVVADLLMALGQRTQLLVTTHSPLVVAEMLRRQRQSPSQVQLMRCLGEDGATRITPFADPLPLFERQEIEDALKGTEDERVVQALLTRGWLDG